MQRSYILILAMAATATGLTTSAFGASTATNNQCWGDIANQMGQLGAMGVHSAADSPFVSQPRVGAANANTTADGEPGDGGLGNHAIRVGGLVAVAAASPTFPDVVDKDGNTLTEPLLCDGTSGNPGPAAIP